MKWFYFLVNLGDKSLPFNVWQAYFVNNGGFTKAFLIGTLIALAFIILFYLLVGFGIKKLAKTWVWVCGLVVAMLLSFVLTKTTVGYTPKSGLGNVLEQQYKKLPDKTEEHVKAYNNAKTELKKEAKRIIPKLKPFRNLCVTNFIWTGLLYFLLSVVAVAILPQTNYCKIIPFAIGGKRRN